MAAGCLPLLPEGRQQHTRAGSQGDGSLCACSGKAKAALGGRHKDTGSERVPHRSPTWRSCKSVDQTALDIPTADGMKFEQGLVGSVQQIPAPRWIFCSGHSENRRYRRKPKKLEKSQRFNCESWLTIFLILGKMPARLGVGDLSEPYFGAMPKHSVFRVCMRCARS